MSKVTGIELYGERDAENPNLIHVMRTDEMGNWDAHELVGNDWFDHFIVPITHNDDPLMDYYWSFCTNNSVNFLALEKWQISGKINKSHMGAIVDCFLSREWIQKAGTSLMTLHCSFNGHLKDGHKVFTMYEVESNSRFNAPYYFIFEEEFLIGAINPCDYVYYDDISKFVKVRYVNRNKVLSPCEDHPLNRIMQKIQYAIWKETKARE